jgi:ketosteroid isomerase-like protein
MAEVEDLARRWVAGFASYEADSMVALSAPDVKLYLPRNELEGGGYRGHDGVRQAIADLRESWAGIEYDLQWVESGDDVALTYLRTTNQALADGPEVTYDLWIVIRVRNRLVTYSRPHLDEAPARADAGLEA